MLTGKDLLDKVDEHKILGYKDDQILETGLIDKNVLFRYE